MKKYDYFLFILVEDTVEESVFEDLFDGDDLSIKKSTHKQGVLWTLVYVGDQKEDVYASVLPLVKLLSTDRLNKIKSQILSITLNAVVYHDTFTSSFSFPKDVIQLIKKVDFDMELEVTCYPTDFGEI